MSEGFLDKQLVSYLHGTLERILLSPLQATDLFLPIHMEQGGSKTNARSALETFAGVAMLVKKVNFRIFLYWQKF